MADIKKIKLGNTTYDIVDAGAARITDIPDAPYIASNGNWYVSGMDTGVPAQGPKGDPGVISSFGMVNHKSIRLVSGETFLISPNTIVMVNGQNFTQTLVDKNGNVLVDSEGNNLPNFGGGLLFNTSEEDGFRSSLLISVSQFGSVATVSSKNFDATVGDFYVKAGATPTWIFYTELTTDDTSAKAFEETGDHQITFYNSTAENKATVVISGQTHNTAGVEHGGNITLKGSDSANSKRIDLWAKNDSSSRIEVSSTATKKTVLNGEDIAIQEYSNAKWVTKRSLRDVLTWGYKIAVVTALPSSPDSNTIYIVTG